MPTTNPKQPDDDDLPHPPGLIVTTITDGDPAICRDLCNDLMAYQASVATIHPERLQAMSYETRLAPSFAKADRKEIVLLANGPTPIGYVYSSVEYVTTDQAAQLPPWANASNDLGFYPPGYQADANIGVFNNLYLQPDYRGQHLGSYLTQRAMRWLTSHDDVQDIFVYVSNGNDAVVDLYRSLGFVHSHEVANGFITALIYRP